MPQVSRVSRPGISNRVQKSSGKIYWYGAGSQVLDESDASGNITDEYVFFGGKRIAHRDSSSNLYYYAEDFLGTSRVITTASGTVCYEADFYPFGGERVVTKHLRAELQVHGQGTRRRDRERRLWGALLLVPVRTLVVARLVGSPGPGSLRQPHEPPDAEPVCDGAGQSRDLRRPGWAPFTISRVVGGTRRTEFRNRPAAATSASAASGATAFLVAKSS